LRAGLTSPLHAPILPDQRVQQNRRMLCLDACEMCDLVAAGRPGRPPARLLASDRAPRQQPPLTNLPRDFVVILE
jgi:hypothetical protein